MHCSFLSISMQARLTVSTSIRLTIPEPRTGNIIMTTWTSSDAYRHSKWLSFMEKRLRLAKKLLNPDDSVLIVTIDEKEYLHLGCLLEEIFSEARIQMISSVISPRGAMRKDMFTRVEEYIYYVFIGKSAIITLWTRYASIHRLQKS